ncbi:PE domain-containing protein [Actinosynnema sp. NPDC053489]|uniref:PE domain-containing protein n=1 Tax=Actinosynnema sp. NPDC053489 TaxID=3363916 RepID=UPI0037CBF105
MPYQHVSGSAGLPAASSTSMQVEPDKVLDLIATYEGVRNSVMDFLEARRDSLRVRPLADDEVSGDAADAFADHSAVALDVTKEFLVQLTTNIEQLREAARTYGLVEEGNTDVIRKLRGIADR